MLARSHGLSIRKDEFAASATDSLPKMKWRPWTLPWGVQKRLPNISTAGAISYRGCGGAATIRYEIGTSAVAVAGAAAAAAVAAWMSQGAKQPACQVARELGSQAISEVLIPWVLGS